MGFRGVGRFGIALLLFLPGSVMSARAQGVQGFGQVQYQDLTTAGEQRDSWVSILQMNHATRWWDKFDVSSQFEFRRFAALNGQERNVVPRGMARITHQYFGLNGYYRPSSTTDRFGLVTRQQEAAVTGYLARPGLPHADFNWTRRHRSAGPGSGGAVTGITRNAHLSQDLGRLNLQASYGDLTDEPRDPRFRKTTQRTYEGAASLRLFSGRRASSTIHYDYTYGVNTLSSGEKIRNRVHEANTNASITLSRRADINMGYNYRRSEIRGPVTSNLNDHDGNLLLNARPTRSVVLTTGGGVRTARTGTTEDVLGSVIFSASAEGRVRPGWTGSTGASHTINWLPDRPGFAINSWRGGSRFRLNRGLDVNADLLVSSVGDTGNTLNRVVSQASYGFTASPLRPIRIAWSGRVYRAGPSIGRASSNSVSSIWDLRWVPGGGLELGASFSSTSPLTRGGATVSTRQSNVRWSPSRLLQLDANYSRSTQARSDAGTGDLTGRELIGARVLWAPLRLTRVSASINTVDPGHRATRAQQIDLTLTQNFGR